MIEEYYIIENGDRIGPFTRQALKYKGITPDTLIWRPGLADWVKVSALEEADDLLAEESAFGAYAQAEQQEDPYFAMLAGVQVGPASISELIARGLNAQTPVWRNGMADWQPASTCPDIMAALNARREPPRNPFIGNQQNSYGQFSNQQYAGQPYGNQQYGQQPFNGMPKQHTNWLPWAICGTILGLCSCLGLIFGIIGIINANKANTYYMMGDDVNGDIANSSAKSMTLVSLILGGVGIVGGIISGITNAFALLSL